MIELGDKVKDRVSGVTGIVTSIHDFLYGCRRISVQQALTKGAKYEDALTFDEPQLKLVKAGAYQVEEDLPETGGPRAVPKSKTTGGSRITGKR